jgi:hypothetical protein
MFTVLVMAPLWASLYYISAFGSFFANPWPALLPLAEILTVWLFKEQFLPNPSPLGLLWYRRLRFRATYVAGLLLSLAAPSTGAALAGHAYLYAIGKSVVNKARADAVSVQLAANGGLI